MPAAAHPVTVADFSQLAEDHGPAYHELRQGEIVPVTRPKWKHFLAQRNIRRLLDSLAEPGSIADTELAFRPLPDYELRVADVAWVSAARIHNVDPEGYFDGVPELVVEILSPSNSTADLQERKQLCLGNGCLEFWTVDTDLRNLTVTTPDGQTVSYAASAHIPLSLFGNAIVPVREITG